MRTDKSVVLPLVYLGSTSYQVQQLKDKVAEIQANSGAFWRFLCFEIGFLLSSLSQLSLRLHLTWVAWMFFLWIGTEFFLRCGSRTATARNQRLESRSSTGKLWPVALDFSESRLHATEKTLRRVTIWNGLFEMYARRVQRVVFLVRCSSSKTSLLKLRWATTHLFEAIPYCRPASNVGCAFIQQTQAIGKTVKWCQMYSNVNSCQMDVSRLTKFQDFSKLLFDKRHNMPQRLLLLLNSIDKSWRTWKANPL